jgi:transposase
LRVLKARNVAGLKREIEQAKERFGLPEEAAVISCYEAGRDGFWLHRYLEANDVKNVVVDSASIEVNRRFRRAKTDRLDVGQAGACCSGITRGAEGVERGAGADGGAGRSPASAPELRTLSKSGRG